MKGGAFVVGLAGVPGAGKSTLARALAQRWSVGVVQYDQFQTLTRMSHQEKIDWFRRGADPNEMALSELLQELATRTRWDKATPVRPAILFETPYGRLHRATGAYIDFLVWVDTPFDLAVCRAMQASLDLLQRQSPPPPPQALVQWQRNYLSNYPVVRDMYLAHRAGAVADAQLVVDGALPTAELANLVQRALDARPPVA